MLFIIHGIDKPDGLPLRLAHYEAHKAFLRVAPFLAIVTQSLPKTIDFSSSHACA
jgi:hypothetical protein